MVRFGRSVRLLVLQCAVGFLAVDAEAGPLKRVVTDKAQYAPAEAAVITATITNTTGAPINGFVQLTARRLATSVHSESQALALANGATQAVSFTWTVPAVTLQGYGLDVDVYSGGAPVLAYSGALDVNDDWTKVPRYGFLSDFPVTQTAAQSDSILAELAKYHINGVQFYDWMYKHHDVLKQDSGVYADTYLDVAGRTLSLTTIRNQVQAAVNRGMWPMAYHLAYGELTAYAAEPSLAEYGQFIQPGLARPDSHPLLFWGSTIWLMNPGDTGWQNYIYGEFNESLREMGFRGLHIDQLGDRGTRYDTGGNVLDLTTSIPDFINGARTAARDSDPGARVIFNTVDAWPAQQVGATTSDVTYSEVWTPSTYNDLRLLIRSLRQYSPSKQIVLPAYMNRDQANSLAYMDSPSVLLADAAIFANGAFHLELGESHAMLSTEYFPDHTPAMHSSLITRLYDYYDFAVRYENQLYENTIDITDEIVDWISLAEGVSKNATAGTVWTIAKSRPEEIVVHHVNLIGVDDDWRDTTTAPTVKTSYDYKYYTSQPIAAVYLASPDSGNGRPVELSFTTGRDEPYGNYVYVPNIPRLEYWNMLVLRTGTASSPPTASSHEVYIPWHTATVDGTVDSGYGVAIASDNENGTNGQAGSPMDLQNLYMSHDTDHLYIAFTINQNVTTGGTDWGKYVLSIDTDGVSGSGAPSPGWGRAATFSNPHLPDYELYTWVNALPYEVTDVQRWRYAGGAWGNVGSITSAALDSAAGLTVIEYKVAKADVGVADPPRFWIEAWSTGGAGTDNAQDSINNPKDDANPGDWTTSTPLKVSTFCHLVPPRIGGLKVETIQDRLKLTWNASADGGFSRYEVYRASAPFQDITNLTPLAVVSDRATATYTDAAVAPGETYYYAVVAANRLGDSDPLVYRWEAERGLVGRNAAMDADHAGYTGDGFVDQLDADEANDWVQHTVTVAEAGNYPLTFRYAAGGVATTGRLDINGVEMAWPTLAQTASWATWSTATQSAWLQPGQNAVKFGYEGGNAAFNYDRLEMENPSGSVSGKVVLNELVPVSVKDSSGLDAEAWVELYNASDSSVSLGSWRLSNHAGSIYTFPANFALPARSFAVVTFGAGVADTWYTDSAARLYAAGTPPAGFFNTARACGLYNADWQIVDFLSFGAGAGADSDAVSAGIWTSGDSVSYAAAEGISIHRDTDGRDNDSSGDWRVTAQAGRASEGGTNDGMDIVDDSVGSLAFMMSDWSAPLPADTHAVLGDTLYIQAQNDAGDPTALDFVQVLVTATTESAIVVTLRETANNSNILRGVIHLRTASVSSADRIGAVDGAVVGIQDFEGPDRTDTILVGPAGCIVTGIVALEAGTSESGVAVWLYNGVDTYSAVSRDTAGSFTLTGIANGSYRIRFTEAHHLALRAASVIVIAGADTYLGTVGELRAGDVNGDNRVNLFDAALIRVTVGSAYEPADVDRNGVVNAADLGWVRLNFGRVGDGW